MREQGLCPQSQELSWVVENTDVEPENMGYFELLAHDREKGRLTSKSNKLRPFKWKLERFSTFNL